MPDQVDYVEELDKKYKRNGQSMSDKKSTNINERVDYAQKLSHEKKISNKRGAEIAVKVLQIIVLVMVCLNILSIFACVFGFNIVSDTMLLNDPAYSTDIPAAFPTWVHLFLYIIIGTAGAWILFLIPAIVIICMKSEKFPVKNLIVWIVTILGTIGLLFVATYFTIGQEFESFLSKFLIVFIFIGVIVMDLIMLGNLMCGAFMKSLPHAGISSFISGETKVKLLVISFSIAAGFSVAPVFLSFVLLIAGILTLGDAQAATGAAKVIVYLAVIARYGETAACAFAGIVMLLVMIDIFADYNKIPVSAIVVGTLCMSLNLLIAYFVRWALITWKDSVWTQVLYTIPAIFYGILIGLSVKLGKKNLY